MFGGFVDLGSKFRVSDMAPERGGAEGEAGGGEGDDEHKPGATADPIGSPAEEKKAGDTPQPGDVKERGGFFRGLLMQFHGDVPPVIQRRLDLPGVKAVVGAFPGLHDERGGEVTQESEGEGDGEDGGIPGDQCGGQKGGQEKDEGDGQMVEHDVEVLGLPESGDHRSRVGRKGGLFQRKTNG